VAKSRNPTRKIQDAIQKLLHDETAKVKAAGFARAIAQWEGPRLAAAQLLKYYGAVR